MFQIKPDRIDTEIKTIRFPVHLINQIENAIVCKNVSFSGFVIQACQYALDHMDYQGPENNPDNIIVSK